MRRNIIADILIIIGLAQLLISIKVEAATIFVDGMWFKMTVFDKITEEAIETKGHYREPYLLSSDLGEAIKAKEKNRNFVGWSGNPTSSKDVRQGIDKLKDEIITFHKVSPDEPINITSHSYGTVIAYKALEEISSNPETKDIKIDTLITMGSPLGEESIGQRVIERRLADIPKNETVKTPENVNCWINYYADDDNIGGKINKEGVKDIGMPGDHMSYYTNPNSARWIVSTSDTIKKFSEEIDKLGNFSQQTVKDISTQQALEFPKILPAGLPKGQISPQLAKQLSEEKISNDLSKQAEYTSHQNVTPVKVSFTQTFEGLLTQTADYVGSQGGNHSGTFTEGTRIGDGSRPGDFSSGSFSGRTIAETGYTPATHSNTAFEGSSVGTVSAKGFQEGQLKGTMTVTVPAGTQTATLTGNITIDTDGSLSMPSYSGPVTVNATGVKVGTMTGDWNQGPTK